jgi:hypothetical protein
VIVGLDITSVLEPSEIVGLEHDVQLTEDTVLSPEDISQAQSLDETSLEIPLSGVVTLEGAPVPAVVYAYDSDITRIQCDANGYYEYYATEDTYFFVTYFSTVFYSAPARVNGGDFALVETDQVALETNIVVDSLPTGPMLIQPEEGEQSESPVFFNWSIPAIVPDDIVQAQSLDETEIGGVPAIIEPANISQSQSLEASELSVAYVVSPLGILQQQTLDLPDIDVSYEISPNDSTQSQELGDSAVTVGATLSPDDILQTQSIEALTLIPNYVFDPAQITQNQTMGQPALSVAYSLSPEDLTQVQTIGSELDVGKIATNIEVSVKNLYNITVNVTPINYG